MTKLNYILKSVLFFKKQHLAVFAGTIITTAVLTGALIVGDSVKASLTGIVENRLGNVQYVLQSNDRFVRAKLAEEISNKLKVQAAPIILLQGISSNPENDTRINKTQVIGIDSSFWLLSNKKMPDLNTDEAIISTNTAEKLNLKVNDELVLRVEKLSVIPINSPFSAEEIPSVSFRLKIKAIADENNLGRFSLKNNQVAPYNVFISREYLSAKLDVNGLVNVVLLTEQKNIIADTDFFNSVLSDVWNVKDAGIEINKIDEKGNCEITSDRIFIDKQISLSIINKIPTAKTILTYLVNSISLKKKSTPYSFVTAVSKNYYSKELKENEILINDWLSEDLDSKIGDTLKLMYFVIDDRQNLREDSSHFIVKGIIQTKDSLINRSLMPKFPGFATAISCVEWNTNIPIDLKKIRDKDEKYWNEYRGTPKAVISIEAGKKHWENKFGDYTSIRFNDSTFISSTKTPDQEILKEINPEDLNLSIVDVKTSGMQSASTGVDFGQLFLSLSFFVILAGIILTVMLFVLNLKARKAEIGLLISMGYRRGKILNLQVYESTITVLIGSLFGVCVGILYNYGLMLAINSVWNDIIRTSMMDVSIKPMTLLTGILSGFEISMLTIYVVTYFNLKKTAVNLINNNSISLKFVRNRNKWIQFFSVIIAFGGSLTLILYSILTSVDKNAALFLMSGGLFLVGCITLFYILIGNKNNSDKTSLNKLAFINASRNKLRSITIVILISLGVFVVVITGANKNTFVGSENENNSGTGGYTFWAETSIPLTFNLNTKNGKDKLGFSNDSILNNVNFAQFLSLNGDDASCLNLNHIQNPKIIGVNPEEFNKRKSFSFENISENVNNLNPWTELNKQYGENIIPAFADQSVITWGLLKKLGDTLTYVNESGKNLKIVLVGGLSSSIFQGNILISEKHFKENFPSIGGSKIMLVDVPKYKITVVNDLLNSYLKDYGIDITKTTERLSQFSSVTNTYLSVFMILGGLGVIIGTIGIGILLYRNLLDRKQELSMMLAIGFTKQNIFSLIFKENIYLIFIGISIGIVSSFIGILPSLISISYNMSFTFVFLLVILIFTNALIWIYFQIKKALKKNIIISLRNE
ncbi:MAG: ABC transporter permease [Bacteroidia bacterium]|nr:ABC transporter permease [Bacteroidia bacterium]